jgi:Uncharacterized protein conserved in bacteria
MYRPGRAESAKSAALSTTKEPMLSRPRDTLARRSRAKVARINFDLQSWWPNATKAPMSETAYRVLTIDEFSKFLMSGTFEGTAKDLAAGFIHLSTSDQLSARVEKFRAQGQAAYILAINLEKVEGRLKWEKASDGDIYPHLYQPITRDIVTVIEQSGGKRALSL